MGRKKCRKKFGFLLLVVITLLSFNLFYFDFAKAVCICPAKDGSGTTCVGESSSYVNGCNEVLGCQKYAGDCVIGGAKETYHCDCPGGCQEFEVQGGALSIKCSDFGNSCKDKKETKGVCTTKQDALGELKKSALSLNPAKLTSPAQMIGRGVYFSLAIIGMVTLVLYIWAGVLWMTSAGNAERKSQAMKIFVWTTMGALVIATSYMLVSFIFKQVILK